MTMLLLVPFAMHAQHPHAKEPEKRLQHHRQTAPATSASHWFDAQYYRLELSIHLDPNYLRGAVTVRGICTAPSSAALTLDLSGAMTIDSVVVDGASAFFIQRSSSFDVTLSRPYVTGESITALIYYKGTPVPSGFGSFSFSQHNGTPWIFSLSEPYGSMDWWPCRNTPSDKADSADILITCDSAFKAGSQGVLVSAADAGGGRRQYHWKTRYPIAPYLISVAVTNYTQFSDWFRYGPSDSLEILNYVLPEHEAEARPVLAKTVDMLRIFTPLFGPYPFLREKYGHAEFTGGGMEHQTMTSLGVYDEEIVAHELAHQWFGDMITCRSWSDLWLNEGFAEYSTGLYLERMYGTARLRQYMAPLMASAAAASGVLGRPDTTRPGALFNFALMYAKGAAVLQMLRHVTGDSLFFRILRTYAGHPPLMYATATTQDFRDICEQVTGTDLGYFFRQWVYGSGVPTYVLSGEWKENGALSAQRVTIRQLGERTDPPVFRMPLPVRFRGTGMDTVITLLNDAAEQNYDVRLPVRPTSMELDPEGLLLRKVLDGNDIPPGTAVLYQNYPNPFSTSTTIRYQLSAPADVTLKIYDILGREVETLVKGREEAGVYEMKWVSRGWGNSTYFCKLTANTSYLICKITKIL
ncbi:MAG: T9SS type A sorting domain-containing protein [Bacteroidetes bacterium]|nr:T9SS type A sorting domain-containing protein [Bacteroidota bacterium]